MGCLYERKQKLPSGEYRELPTWWIKYYQNGRAVRESTGTTKETKARRMLRSREGDVEHGLPVNPKMGRISFEDAADDILNDYRANGRRSLSGLERRLTKHLKPFFKGGVCHPSRRLTFARTSRSANQMSSRQGRAPRRKSVQSQTPRSIAS